MNNKFTLLLFLILTIFIFKTNLIAGPVEDILSQEVKCPEHDRPEVVAEVDKLVQEGKNKDEVLDALAVKFGGAILVNPRDKDVNMTLAYIIPITVLILGLIFISAFIGKWIKKTQEVEQKVTTKTVPDSNKDKYEKIFDEEYKNFKERS